jgi:hypothetical protein
MTVTTDKIKLIVKETVREMFLHLDLNINDPDDIIAFRKDQQYIRSWRLRVELLTTRAFIALVLTAIPAAFAYAFLSVTRPHP